MSFQFIVLPVQFQNGGIARRAMHEKKMKMKMKV